MGWQQNHTLIVFTGSVALLGKEVICLIAWSCVLWTERLEDRSIQKYLLKCGVSIRRRVRKKKKNILNRFN